MIAPTGGRDDYGSLFHEGGHTEHYANTAAELAFEFRQLGDNSVTESFAFLLENVGSDPLWLSERLGIEDSEAAIEHTRAFRLVIIRRYAAKLAYELELHGPSADLGRMPARYSELLSGAVRVPWPRVSWMADVDDGFYAACYLRAWALETHWRAGAPGAVRRAVVLEPGGGGVAARGVEPRAAAERGRAAGRDARRGDRFRAPGTVHLTPPARARAWVSSHK